ncbi:MAG: ATP-binding protein [Chloroflexi bacterium]|nr:ATP-binding protein [Chloroflexota bacterium]
MNRFWNTLRPNLGTPRAIVASVVAAYIVAAIGWATKLLGFQWFVFILVVSTLLLAIAVLVFLLRRKRPIPPPIKQQDDTGVPLHGPEDFVGRTAELADVVAALLSRRSLLIHGEPGIGKTELAIQSLRSPSVQQAYQGRQHYVNLEGRANISLVTLCDDVARSLGAQAVLQTDDVDQKIPILLENLGSPPPLIAFNNADGPAAVDAVAAFRRLVMDGPLLATSRDAIPGIPTLELKPLNPDAAFRLFARHAGRAPRREERQAVDDILVLLQNNPLAITVAAPLLPKVGAAELSRLLRIRPGQALGPVWAAFDLSYIFLSDKEKPLLAALGVFAGPNFSPEAIQSLFDEDIGLQLGNLVGVSLLRRDQATGRFSLHPLLKEYARGKLENANALKLRLAAFYAGFTAQHTGSALPVLQALDREFVTLSALVTWWQSNSILADASPHLLDIINALAQFMDVRGYWDQRVSWGENAVAAAKALGDERRLASLSHTLAMALQHQGRPEEARDLYGQSLAIEKRLGDQQGIAQSLHQLGMLAQDQGRPEEARDLYHQSLDIEKRLGNQQGIAQSLHQLGILAQAQGRPEEARDLYQQSLET